MIAMEQQWKEANDSTPEGVAVIQNDGTIKYCILQYRYTFDDGHWSDWIDTSLENKEG